MPSDYGLIAEVYDRINAAVDYTALAAFYRRAFLKYGENPEIVLDLACGTGRLTGEMAALGFDMIGVDGSAEMLICAQERLLGRERILLLCQQMEQLDLYGTVDAAVCCLDALNSLLQEGTLRAALQKVSLFLVPGGIFVFDLNTRYKFENIFADNSYVYDYDDFCCIWQNHYDRDTECCDFELTYFNREGELYRRQDELIRERMYRDETIVQLLYETGFDLLERCGDAAFTPSQEGDERIYYIVRKR